MPLSKRINNLHLDPSASTSQSEAYHNGNIYLPQESHINYHHQQLAESSDIQMYHQPQVEQAQVNSFNQIPNGDSDLNEQFAYNPELSASENPNYYEKNKLLYELYVERMRRLQQYSL